MRCDCKSAPFLQTSDVDFAYYVHCPSCGKPWLIEPSPAAGGFAARTTRQPWPEPQTSDAHSQEVTFDAARSAPFRWEGEVRGGHWPEQDGGRSDYLASVRLKGELPPLLLEPAARSGDRPRPGVEQKLADVRLRGEVAVWSTGTGFAEALLAADARDILANVLHSLEFLEVSDSGAHRSALTVRARTPDATLMVAEAVLPAADALVEEGAVFPDALFDAMGVRSDEEVSPDTVTRLVEHVTAATSWVSGHAARVGDAVEARVRLPDAGDLAGVLRVPWASGDATRLAVELDAALPGEGDGELEVWAETGALGSRLRARFEPRLGDEALDDVLHVRGELERAPELLSARALCLRLAQATARVKLTGSALRVRVPAEARDHQQVHAVVEDCMLLWRRLALRRLGITSTGASA